MSKFINRKKTNQTHFCANALIFVFCVFALAGIFVSYLHQVNSKTPKGYEIQNLEMELAKLEDKNKALELEAAELKSMENFDKHLVQLNLVKSENVTYLEEKDVMVVAAK